MRFLLLFAHSSSNDIATKIDRLGVRSVLVGLLLLAVLIAFSSRITKNKRYKSTKKILFVLVALVVIVPSLILAGSNIYLNTVSDSRGAVHWRTGVEFWVCDQEIELRNPRGLFNNKIGSNTLHEHDDKTIYQDGPVVNIEYDASLKKFLELSGGDISENKLIVPTETSVTENDTDGDDVTGDLFTLFRFASDDDKGDTSVIVENGNSCLTLGGYGEVQAFLYTFDANNDTYTQEKLAQPEKFTLSDKSIGSPGQCLIVEFSHVKDRTEKLCQDFGEIDAERCTQFGVLNYDPSICKIREVRSDTNLIIPEGAL